MFQFSKASLSRRAEVDPRLIEISDLALIITTVDFGIPKFGGLRTEEDQQYLHKSGASPICDGIIIKSEHQSGLALDVYAYTGGRASWAMSDLAMVAAAMMQAASQLGHKLEWGGFWKNLDAPHFQLTK